MGKTKKKKKPKNQAPDVEPKELVFAPHSFVINRGKVGSEIMALLKDVRKVLEPFTASHLKVKKKNCIKDFINAAGPLHVTHLVVFSRGEICPYLKICKLPSGPTMTFRIDDFVLARDVISSLKKPITHDKQFSHAPLLVMNNFSGEGRHLGLMATVFQNMIPSINIQKVNPSDLRRCLLLSYETDGIIHLRQYAISVSPTGMSKKVKKLLQSKVPDLSGYDDISEYMLKNEDLSESEAEFENQEVELSEKAPFRGSKLSRKSAVKLVELGPRLTLQLIKIENEVMEGEVLHHQFIVKTEEEKLQIRQEREKQKKEKEKRRKIQEANRKKNLELKEAHKKKSLAGMKRNANPDKDDCSDDDAQWYQKEVGAEPEEDLGLPTKKKIKLSNKPIDTKKAIVTGSSVIMAKKVQGKKGMFFRKKSTKLK